MTSDAERDAVTVLRAAEADAVADARWARERLSKVRQALMTLGEVPSDLQPALPNRGGNRASSPSPVEVERAFAVAYHRPHVERAARPARPESPSPPLVSAKPFPVAMFVRSGVRAQPDYEGARAAAFSAPEWESA